jgi:Flp pilus assembly protein TadD
VQRWAKSYQLPIHRLGADSRTVFAYTDEIDSWIRLGPIQMRRELIQHEEPKPSRAASKLTAVPRIISSEDVARQPNPDRRSAAQEEVRLSVVPAKATSQAQHSVALLEQAESKWKHLSSANLHSITRLYREAIDLDFKSPAAHAGLGQAMIAGVLLGNLRAAHSFRSAQDSVRTALELQPDHPGALCASGWLYLMVDHDFKQAKSIFSHVLSLRHCVMPATLGMALALIGERRAPEAAELLREYSDRFLSSPLATALHIWSEYLAQNSGRARSLIEHARFAGHHGAIFDVVDGICAIDLMGPPEAVAHVQHLVHESPYNAVLQGLLGYAHARAGDEQAVESIAEMLHTEATRARSDTAYPLFLLYAGSKNRRSAVQWLEQSYSEGSLWSLASGCDPILTDMANDPNYQLFLSRILYSAPDQA